MDQLCRVELNGYNIKPQYIKDKTTNIMYKFRCFYGGPKIKVESLITKDLYHFIYHGPRYEYFVDYAQAKTLNLNQFQTPTPPIQPSIAQLPLPLLSSPPPSSPQNTIIQVHVVQNIHNIQNIQNIQNNSYVNNYN